MSSRLSPPSTAEATVHAPAKPKVPIKSGSPSATPGRLCLALLLPLVCLAGIYWPLFPELAEVWDTDPNYSHGYFVPLVSLAFVWMAWHAHGSPVHAVVPRRAVWEGTFQIIVGLLLHLVVWYAGNLFLDVLSLMAILRGLLLIWGGPQGNRAFGFPVFFLIFMAPLPIHWYQPFAIWMQQLVTDLSTFMLEFCQIPVYREGYFILLPGYTMEVAEACNGLRQLTAILALGVAIGHMSGRGSWFRWTLGLLSIPIAIVANCIRVVLSGLILIVLGPEWAEGVFHTIEGLVIVALSALLIVAVAWMLGRVEDRWRRSRSSGLEPRAG